MVEIVKKLQSLTDALKYSYVGFGSIFFSDFIHFHRNLGIKKMTSIEDEKDPLIQKRFEFNKPYKAIEMRFGLSTDILSSLEWDQPVFLWLDYDGKFDATVLADIKIFCQRAPSGSLFAVSFNAKFSDNIDSPHASPFEIDAYNAISIRGSDEIPKDQREILASRIGARYVPVDITESDLGGTKFTKLCRRIINTVIKDEFSIRNANLEEVKKLKYKQIFNFIYQDGAKMQTIGGIVCNTDDSAQLEKCDLESLPYVMQEEKSYEIRVPIMTLREIRYWETQLPIDSLDDAARKGIPGNSLKELEKIYRFFPHFTEAELA